jgi:polar amino acid transport system substrate-binding protein
MGWSLTLLPMAVAENGPHSRPGTLENVLKNGTVRVGVSLFTPWTLKTKNGAIVGFEIDVAKQLAKDLGVKPEFHVLDWKKIIPALLNREIDIIIAGIVITPQRALKVNFSQPYDSSGIGLVTNISLTKTFKGPKDLNRPDVIMASVTGTISEDLARRVFPKATMKTFATSQEAMQAVTKGKVHGYVEHKPITTFLVLDHPETVDEPLSKPLLETKAGFAVNKGDPDFINFLNAWIISHKADTWLASVHKYWFDSLAWQKEIGKIP